MTNTALRILITKLSPQKCVSWDAIDYTTEIDWFMEQDKNTQENIILSFTGTHFGEFINDKYLPKKSVIELKKERGEDNESKLLKAMRNKGMKINNQR